MPQPSIPLVQRNLALTKYVSGLAKAKSKIHDDKVNKSELLHLGGHYLPYAGLSERQSTYFRIFVESSLLK